MQAPNPASPPSAWLTRPGWKSELMVLLGVGLALRLWQFVGFGLGDDLSYINCAGALVNGSYPVLEPLNQYAYRPVLLLVFAAGMKVFGFTDLGLVSGVLLISLVTLVLVYFFAWRFLDRAAASWCAVLFAFEPANVVNSTTMTNDVLLGCFVFGSFFAFLAADREPQSNRRSVLLFAAAGGLMMAAFLVKVAILPALVSLAAYSAVTVFRRRWSAVCRQAVFYGTFVLLLIGLCSVYWWVTGDFFWQFRSEFAFYKTYPPYLGAVDYVHVMWEYPRNLFLREGDVGYAYIEHGYLFWLFVPAAVWVFTSKVGTPLKFLVLGTLVIFSFFQFYPAGLSPHYIPLSRQSRHFEMFVPAVVVVVGFCLFRLSRRFPVAARVVLVLLLGDFVFEASRRGEEYGDSQDDVADLARYSRDTIARTGKRLLTDTPARNALIFYLRDVPVRVDAIEDQPLESLHDCYVAIGGARSFWWDRDLVFQPDEERLGVDRVLTYVVERPLRPWRSSPLRVFYLPPAK